MAGKRAPLALALFAAPAIAGAIVSLIAALIFTAFEATAGTLDLGRIARLVHTLLTSWVVNFIGATIALLTIGIAFHAFANSQGMTRAFFYAGAGAACGFLMSGGLIAGLGPVWMAIGMMAPGMGMTGFAALGGFIAWVTLLGGLTGYAFWALRRPDLAAPANLVTAAP